MAQWDQKSNGKLRGGGHSQNDSPSKGKDKSKGKGKSKSAWKMLSKPISEKDDGFQSTDDFCPIRDQGPHLPEGMEVSALSLFELFFNSTILALWHMLSRRRKKRESDMTSSPDNV